MCRNVSSVVEHTFTLHQVSDTVGTRRAKLEVQSFHHNHSSGLTPFNSLWLVGVIISIQKKTNSNPNIVPYIKNVICYITGSHVHESKYSFSRIGAYPLSLACFLPLMMFAVVPPELLVSFADFALFRPWPDFDPLHIYVQEPHKISIGNCISGKK